MTFTLEKDFFPKTVQNDTPKRIARHQRQEEFIRILFNEHITFTRAAEQANISRTQAYRWFNEWKHREGVEIDREFWQLLMKVRERNPEKALECLTRLKYRMIPDRIQLEEKITDIKVVIVEHSTTSNIQPPPETTGNSPRPTQIQDR